MVRQNIKLYCTFLLTQKLYSSRITRTLLKNKFAWMSTKRKRSKRSWINLKPKSWKTCRTISRRSGHKVIIFPILWQVCSTESGKAMLAFTTTKQAPSNLQLRRTSRTPKSSSRCWLVNNHNASTKKCWLTISAKRSLKCRRRRLLLKVQWKGPRSATSRRALRKKRRRRKWKKAWRRRGRWIAAATRSRNYWIVW